MTPGPRFGLLVACLLATAAARGGEADAPPPAFKIDLDVYGAGPKPLTSAAIAVEGGVGYQFLDSLKQEVQVIDPARSAVRLLQLQKRTWTEVTSAEIEVAVERLRRSIAAAADRREKSGDRSDRVAASMSRDLIDPNLKTTFDAAAGRLTLSNPSVEVVALGRPPTAAERPFLAPTRHILASLARLSALRDPANLPPFARIAALDGLSARGLLPVEVSILYRLSGPPRRLRWTFRITPTLTDRERQAVDLVSKVRAAAQFVPYGRYDRPPSAVPDPDDDSP